MTIPADILWVLLKQFHVGQSMIPRFKAEETEASRARVTQLWLKVTKEAEQMRFPLINR